MQARDGTLCAVFVVPDAHLANEPLADTTVAGLAWRHLTQVVTPSHIAVAVGSRVEARPVDVPSRIPVVAAAIDSPADAARAAMGLLAGGSGADLPGSTADHAAATEACDDILVVTAGMPLLRPGTLRALVNRHRLTGADVTHVAPAHPVGGRFPCPLVVRREWMGSRAGAGPPRVATQRVLDPDELLTVEGQPDLRSVTEAELARIFAPHAAHDTGIHFGTGGWRAVIGEGFTLANVRKLAQSLANDLIRLARDHRPVVVGGDRRFLSRESVKAAAEVFAANGIDVVMLADDVPTPLVTFAVPHLGASCGVMVTASHNPPEWNGIKVFGPDGSLLLDVETDAIAAAAQHMAPSDVVATELPLAAAAGAVREANLLVPYIDALEKVIDVDAARGADLRVVVDPMYGTSQLTLGTLLSDMRVRTEFIHSAHNPLFADTPPAPDAERLTTLMAMIRKGSGRYSLGLATDGDSDRIGIVDEGGRYVSTNDLLLLLYWYLHEVRGEGGAVVRNIATTHLLDRLARHFGERSLEVPVGFKYITAGMDDTGALLGGEASGGLTIRGWLRGKDGIFACGLVVEMLARTGRTVGDLLEEIHRITGRLYFSETTIPATPEMRHTIPGHLTVAPPTVLGGLPVRDIGTADGFKFALPNDNWALLRFSGTEPLLRLTAEASSRETATAIIDELATAFR